MRPYTVSHLNQNMVSGTFRESGGVCISPKMVGLLSFHTGRHVRRAKFERKTFFALAFHVGVELPASITKERGIMHVAPWLASSPRNSRLLKSFVSDLAKVEIRASRSVGHISEMSAPLRCSIWQPGPFGPVGRKTDKSQKPEIPNKSSCYNMKYAIIR